MKQKERIAQALICIKEGHPTVALEHYKRLLTQYPNAIADALIPLYHRLQTHPEDHTLRLLITELYITRNFFTEARHELEELYEENPDYGPLYTLLGKLWGQTRDPQILFIFESAVAQNIYNSVILDILPIHLAKHNLEKGIHLFIKLIAAFPEHTHYHHTLAELYIQADNHAAALTEYKRLIGKSPMHAADIARRMPMLIPHLHRESHLFLVHLYALLCDPDSCATHLETLWPDENLLGEYERLITLFPQNTRLLLSSSRYLIIQNRYSEGIEYLAQLYALSPDTHKEAIEALLHAVLVAYPKQVYAHQLLLQISMANKTYQTSLYHIGLLAEFQLEDTTSLHTDLHTIASENTALAAHSYLLSAKIHMYAADYEAALEYTKKAAYALPQAAKHLEAQIYGRQNNHAKALTAITDYHLMQNNCLTRLTLEAAIDIQKRHYTTTTEHADTMALGFTHAAAGYLHEAIACLQKIPMDNPNSPLAIQILANAYLEQGKFESALRHLKNQDPSVHTQHTQNWQLTVYFLTAIAHTFMGQTESAIDALESIVSHSVDFPYAPALLTRFKTLPATQYRGRMLSWILSSTGPVLIALPSDHPAHPHHVSLALPHQETGIGYALKQQYTAAKEALDLASQLAPDNPNTVLNNAYIHAIQGDITAALSYLTPEQRARRSANTLILEAGLLDLQGNTEAALSLLQTQARPSAFSQINAAFLHWKLGDYDNALAIWQHNLSEIPAFPFVARCLSPIQHFPQFDWFPEWFRFPSQ